MIVLIDTTVFLEILNVPGFNQNRKIIKEKFSEFIEIGASLFLPFATIVETGNHIAQLADGRERRSSAEKFVRSVLDAVDGNAPWQPMAPPDIGDIRDWLIDFPDSATRGLGIGDLSIVKQWEALCRLHTSQRILIWSTDGDLAGYHREV